LVEHGIKQEEIADLLGIDVSNANQKINGNQNFTLPQVQKICMKYDISADIFLP
jgi:transcriptional regulator with XRE-family HTH domain